MIEKIQVAVEELRSNEDIQGFDEARVKQQVVIRLLEALCWNQYGDEVIPEYSVGDGSVDYSLRINGENKVFVEVKRPSVNLEGHRRQLLNYSFEHSVHLAVLTNGLNWWFYLPLRTEVHWEDRKFCNIRLGDTEFSPRLADFLFKESVDSGAAVERAEAHLAQLQNDRTIEENLPRAWKDLVTYPDDSLVELLDKSVEGLCGFRAGPERIRRFLQEKANEVVGTWVERKRPNIAPRPQTGKRKPFSFEMLGIPTGAALQFVDNPEIECVVVNKRNKVRYDRQETTLSPLAQELKGSTSVQGPAFWLYEGEKLTDRRARLESNGTIEE